MDKCCSLIDWDYLVMRVVAPSSRRGWLPPPLLHLVLHPPLDVERLPVALHELHLLPLLLALLAKVLPHWRRRTLFFGRFPASLGRVWFLFRLLLVSELRFQHDFLSILLQLFFAVVFE